MEGRNNLFWKVLFSLLIMAVYGSCSAAYAAEFGGFEVSTGTGEYEGTGEEWEDEPVCNTPEQNDSNTQERYPHIMRSMNKCLYRIGMHGKVPQQLKKTVLL